MIKRERAEKRNKCWELEGYNFREGGEGRLHSDGKGPEKAMPGSKGSSVAEAK